MKKLLLVTFWFYFPVRVIAQPAPEILPAPRSEVITIVPTYFDRPPAVGQRNVWELLAPDYSGRMRPRVILAPGTSYYLYNGRPYPWTTTNSLPYMPYALD